MDNNHYGYLEKIISGGQTGVDRAALDAAIECNLEHGGWCPKNRRAEDGSINRGYKLTETENTDYATRTELNIRDSDGTLILNPGDMLEGGTLLTKNLAKQFNKPFIVIDLNNHPDYKSIWRWIKENKINSLNIAGPRESKHPGIYFITREYIINWLHSK